MKDYNNLIADTFNQIALLVRSFNNQFSCISKKYTSFYSLPSDAKLVIDCLPDCLISFETFTHKAYGKYELDHNKEPKVTTTENIIVVFEKSTFVLPNNSEQIKELARKMSGKQLKLTEVSNIEKVQVNSEIFEPVCTFDKPTIKLIKEAGKIPVKDSYIPQLECVCVDSYNVVSTDSHRCFKQPHNLSINSEILLTLEAVKFIKTAKTDIDVLKSNKRIKLVTGGESFEFNIVDIKYPNYNSVWPTKTNDIVVNRNELIEALKINSIYANQASELVKLNFNDGLIVSSQDIDFSISGFSKIVYSGNWQGEIGFKSSYLLQILNIGKSKEVTLKITDPDKAAIVNDVLLMPMILNGNN